MSKKYLLCYLLGFILLLALLLRILGLDYGLPYFLINDERTLVYTALKMGELKTLIPAFHPEEFEIMYYGPLMSYVYLIFLAPFILIQYLIGHFASFSELSNYFILNPGPIWLIARTVNALIGVITVYLMYLIGRKMFNHWVGLISALFLTFSFLHIQFSHFTRLWGPTLFFICLIMLLSAYIYKSPRRKYYLGMGIVSGLAFGINYAAALGMTIFLIAHFLSNRPACRTARTYFWEKLKDKNLWLTLIIFILLVLVFILLSPQLFLSWTGTGRLAGTLAGAKSLTNYLQLAIAYLRLLLFDEPVILIFALLGLVVSWFKSKKIFFASLSWPIIYITFLYFLFYAKYTNLITHYIIVIIPWLILLASFTVYRLCLIFKSHLIKTIILISVFIYPLATAIQYVYLLSQKDTRISALEWVEENIPAGSKIMSNWSYINPIPTKEAILFQKAIDESSLRAADYVLLNLSDEKYPQPAYDILRLAYINKERPLAAEDYQYFLMVFWDERDVGAGERTMIEKGKLIKEFRQGKYEKAEDINARFLKPVSSLFSLKRLGPIVRIYEL